MKGFHMKILVGLLLYFALQMTFIPTGQCANTTKMAATVKIGFLLPLGTITGDRSRKGCELAIRHLNKKHAGSYKFMAEWEDSRKNPSASGTRMEELAADINIIGVIGPVDSGPAIAAADVSNRSNLVTISPLASTPALSSPGDFFYRTWPSDASDASVASKYTREVLSKEKAVVLNIGAPYGQGLAKAFVNDFHKRGGKVLDTIEYPANMQTFGSIATRVIKQKPDVLYFVGYPPDMAEILRELRSRNISFPIVSAAIVSDPTVVKLAGKNLDGVIFPFPNTFNPKNSSNEMRTFFQEYKDAFGTDPGFLAAQSYDSTMLVAHAILLAAKGGTKVPTRGEVHKAMEEIRAFSGATGNFQLDENGDAIREFQMFKILNGAMSPIQ